MVSINNQRTSAVQIRVIEGKGSFLDRRGMELTILQPITACQNAAPSPFVILTLVSIKSADGPLKELSPETKMASVTIEEPERKPPPSQQLNIHFVIEESQQRPVVGPHTRTRPASFFFLLNGSIILSSFCRDVQIIQRNIVPLSSNWGLFNLLDSFLRFWLKKSQSSAV